MAAFAAVLIGCGPGATAPRESGVGRSGTPTGAATAGATGPANAPTNVPTPAPSAGTAALPDPCILITLEEASAAVLAQVSAGLHELVSEPLLGSGRTCRFRNAGGRDGEATTYTWPSPGDQYETWKLQQSQFGRVKELAGVGDKAFTVGNGECNVVKGAILLQVLLHPADGFKTDPEPRTIVLCQQAVARL